MSRFSPLFQHFEQTVGPMLEHMPEVNRAQLVFSYRDGVYRVYESQFLNPPHVPKTEVNPAASLTSFREVWFFQGDRELEAHVEYQPAFRPEIFINDLHLPLLQLRVKNPPRISGLQ